MLQCFVGEQIKTHGVFITANEDFLIFILLASRIMNDPNETRLTETMVKTINCLWDYDYVSE